MAPASMACIALCLIFAPGASSPGVSAKTVTVTEGEDIVLECSTSERIHDISEVTVEWRRNNQEIPYVLLFRDGRLDVTKQDAHFKGRVNLTDTALKNGNLSLILWNTNLSDSGVYECYFFGASSGNRKATEELLSNITLKVKEKSSPQPGTGTDGDQTETKERKRPGLTVAVVLCLFFCVLLCICVFIYFKIRQMPFKPVVNPGQSGTLSV